MAANPARGGGANNPAGGGGGNNNNNANNGGGGGGLISNAEHVEFSVKAEEDLYLTGTETTIRRVTAETNYSCLMLKTQRFSSLFRHYAKYHGLRKDDLEYYFVNCLENEDTPESVQLQRGDTIMVRKRRKPEPPEVAADDDHFVLDMKELLHDEEHMDALFIIQPPSSSTSSSSNVMKVDATTDSAKSSSSAMIIDDPTSTSSNIHASGATTSTSSAATGAIHIRAHKAVLTARAEYFKALFRTNAAAAAAKSSSATEKSNPDGNTVTLSSTTTTIPTASSSRIHFKESVEAVVNVESFFRENHIRAVLEFIYTNRITNLRKLSTDDLLSILHLSDKWLLRDMKRICEHEIIRSHLSVATVARLYGATEAFNAKRLSRACIEFIMSNLRQVMAHAGFLEEMNHFPHLLLPVLKAAADMIPEGPMHKKQRTTTSGGGSGSNSSAAANVAVVAAAAAAASTPASHSNSSNNNLNLPGVGSGSGDTNMMFDPNVADSFVASLQHGGGPAAAAASAAIAQRLQQQHPPIPPLHAEVIGNVAFRSSPVPDSDP